MEPALPRPRAVIFDLDDTLVDRKASIRAYGPQFYADFRHHFAVEPTPATVGERLAADEGDGYITREAFFEAVLAWPEWRTRPAFQTLCDHWRTHFCPAAVAAEGACELLAALRRQGIAVGMITNGDRPAQDLKLDGAGLRPYLDDIVIAGDHRIYKPDARIFALAMANLGATADATWMVGDHPESDVWGAEQHGLTAFWLRAELPWPAERPRPRYELERLADLLPLLPAASPSIRGASVDMSAPPVS